MWIVRCCGGAFLWSGQESVGIGAVMWGFVPPRSFLGERVGGTRSVDGWRFSTTDGGVMVFVGATVESVWHGYFI